jgi:uncharacterized SAM-binding protein YcdF (DUF218 family)
MSPADDLTLLATYLARRDAEAITELKADILILLGNSLPGSVDSAAKAFDDGVAPKILISGGIGHSTQDLRDAIANHPEYHTIATEQRSEADIFYDILVGHHDIDPDTILLENISTNCGANATESKKLLDNLGETPQSLLLIQDPTMQRRSHAAFERTFGSATAIKSFAPYVPAVYEKSRNSFTIDLGGEKPWPFERFVSLILGEIARLRDDEHGYGPRGQNFIDHIDIPEDVLGAYERLVTLFVSARSL